MERPGSRCVQFLTVIEKVCNKTTNVGIGSKKDSGEDLQQLRNATARILQTVTLTKSDRNLKESFIKQNGFTILMMALREGMADKTTVENIVFILLELLSKPYTGKNASALVSSGASNLLLQILVTESKESAPRMAFMLQLHQLLAKIGSKDSKFPMKGRLSQALSITVSMVKNSAGEFKKLVPLLQVLKLYSTNSVNATCLVKQNCVQLMFRIISLCGKGHSTVLKLALEILCNLTKSKSNAVRSVNVDFITSLLHLHSEWHTLDTKHKNLTLRKLILIALKNFINTKAGRAAFLVADGVNIIFNITRECVNLRNMDNLVLVSSLILRKCCPIDLLPLDNFESLVTFDTPVSDMSNSPLPGEDSSVKMQPNFDTDTWEKAEVLDKGVTLQCYEEESEDAMKDQKDEIIKDPLKKRDLSTELSQRSEKELKFTYEKFFPELQDTESLSCGSDSALSHSSTENQISPGNETPPEELKLAPSDTDISSKPSLCMPTLLTNLQMESPTMKRRSASPHVKERLKDRQTSSPARKGSVREKRSQICDGSETNLSSLLNITSLSTMLTADKESSLDISISTEFPGLRDTMEHNPQVYLNFARQTKSISCFEKVAYPDFIGAKSLPQAEQLHTEKWNVSRENLLDDIDRHLRPEHLINETVYDTDVLNQHVDAGKPTCGPNLVNCDERTLYSMEKKKKKKGVLKFCSQFESGNLRKAIQIREYEYDLLLSSDINTNSHHQWFYFEVSNMLADVPYKFNIINCEKLNSQFNAGMKPVMFSIQEALSGRPFWFRTGSNICYYKNCYTRSRSKSYFTASFQITFQHSEDICYLAYHFPYTYSTLRTHLKSWEEGYDPNQVCYKHQTLCETLSGNPVPLITITAAKSSSDEQLTTETSTLPQDKQYVFLSARVHPGESNSSWVMKGIIDFLMSTKAAAQELRDKYVFKIIPMLNPDGVINGNHRCSLSGNDLNRRWMTPCPKLHPTIFHTKGILLYMKIIDKVPILYCDLHGHSQKKNIFIYGCSSFHSWKVCDTDNPTYRENGEDTSYKILPYILDRVAPAFSLQETKYQVEKIKEGTARVIVWREIGVINSYCMESTYCGFDQGIYKNTHVSTHHLHEMGHRFCESVLQLALVPNVEIEVSSMVSADPSSLCLSEETSGNVSRELFEMSNDSDGTLDREKELHYEADNDYLFDENSEVEDEDEYVYEDEPYASSADEEVVQQDVAAAWGDSKSSESPQQSKDYDNEVNF